MGIQLSDAAQALLAGKNYAVLATVNPDGSPHTSVMWVGRDGDDLLFSTVEGRVKHRNMLRDPRVSVTAIPGRTGRARSAWWSGWWSRRPPGTSEPRAAYPRRAHRNIAEIDVVHGA